MHFVVFVLVIISHVLKEEKEDGRKNQKRLRNTASEGYGPPLNTAFSKLPPSQINCPPLVEVNESYPGSMDP